MTNRFEQQAREREQLADTLAADYASDLPKSISDRVFSLAWEHGHSGGYGDVEIYYVDFADVAGDAWRAGIQAGAFQ